MYSWEITQFFEQRNYKIDSEDYLKICNSSNQISKIKYEPFGDYFEIWTGDGYYWKIKVFRKGEKGNEN